MTFELYLSKAAFFFKSYPLLQTLSSASSFPAEGSYREDQEKRKEKVLVSRVWSL